MSLSEQEVFRFASTLKDSSSYDFTEYTFKSLNRRLEKILNDHHSTLDSLLGKIEKDPGFLEEVVCDITVKTTELFRDPQVWQTLRYSILPRFRQSETINIWHAGCSTGQEVFSMLILLKELDLLEKTTIFGTDINQEALGTAEKGTYKYRFNMSYLDNFDKVIREDPRTNQLHDIPYSKYLYIDKLQDKLIIREPIRKMPLFIRDDLVNHCDFFGKKFDLILCRNVIIYFNFNLQNKVINLFYNNLNNRGILVLGAHESILGPLGERFEKIDLINIKK